MKKITEGISSFSGIILAVFFVFVALDVFTRNVLHVSITWLNEGSTYLFMWMAFLASAVGFVENTHYKLSIFPEKVEKKIDGFLFALEVAADLAFSGLLIWQGILFVKYSSARTTPATGINLGLITLILPLCGVFIVLAVINNSVVRMGRKRKAGEKK